MKRPIRGQKGQKVLDPLIHSRILNYVVNPKFLCITLYCVVIVTTLSKRTTSLDIYAFIGNCSTDSQDLGASPRMLFFSSLLKNRQPEAVEMVRLSTRCLNR